MLEPCNCTDLTVCFGSERAASAVARLAAANCELKIQVLPRKKKKIYHSERAVNDTTSGWRRGKRGAGEVPIAARYLRQY